jgi:hypothetical protein
MPLEQTNATSADETEEVIAPTITVEIEPEATEVEAGEKTPQLLQQCMVETAPTELEEEYTVINVDADGWGEIVRKEEVQLEAIAPDPWEDEPQKTDAIAPVSPLQNAPEATEPTAAAEISQSELELVYEERQRSLPTNDGKLYRIWSEYYERTFEGCTLVKKTTQGILSSWAFREQEGESIYVYDSNHIEEMTGTGGG